MRVSVALSLVVALLPAAAIAQSENRGPPGTGSLMSDMTNGQVYAALPTPDYLAEIARDDAFVQAEARLAVEKAHSPRVRAYAQAALAEAAQAEELHRMAAQIAPAPSEVTPTPLQQAMLAKLQGAEGHEFDRLYIRQQYAQGARIWQINRNYRYTGSTKPLRSVAARHILLIEHRMQKLGDMESLSH